MPWRAHEVKKFYSSNIKFYNKLFPPNYLIFQDYIFISI